MKVDLWAPEFLARKGGIQAFSGFLVEALQRAIGEENVRIFSRNDPSSTICERFNSPVSGSGQWPAPLRAAAFAVEAVWPAMRGKPDLVIAAHLNFSVAARLLKRFRGIPYWCVAHGIEAWDVTRRDRVMGIRGADRVMAVSNFTRERLLQEQSVPPTQVGILPNTFDARIFHPRPKAEYLLRRHFLRADQKIILTVGRLEESERYKGYDKIVHALPGIRQKIPAVHYILAGKGPDQARIEKLASTLGVRDGVTFAGEVSDAELVDYYNLCDVFAMPSKKEGFGIVYLEAMACGKPVLAGNGDGARDPLQDGQLGVLIDPDRVDEIASSLIQILDGTHPLAVIYRPDELRSRTIAAFGFDRFAETLAHHLNDFTQRHSPPMHPEPMQPAG